MTDIVHRSRPAWLLAEARTLVPGVFAALFALALFSGCTRSHYKASADKEVYELLQQKQERVFGQAQPFTIEQTHTARLAGLKRGYQPLAGMEPKEGQAPAGEPPALLTLNDAIMLGIENSREYQLQKEDLYLSALSLTLERRQWRPIFSGSVSGSREKNATDESWTGDSRFGVSQIFATGASLTVALSSQVVRFVTGDPRQAAASTLTAGLTQPLWRGAGARVAKENLIQAERDMVYSIRSFFRYHKSFLVSIASEYYQILEERAVVGNEWRNYQQLMSASERTRMMAKAGRLAQYEVDQAAQDELRARNSWIRAVQQYGESLDSFKIKLALPADANVDVDESELTKLLGQGIIHPAIGDEEAVRQALERRLDLVTARDQVDDARRQVEIAANGLGMDVNLVANASVNSDDPRHEGFHFEDGTYSAGLEIDLPLNRKAERNTYRRSLIQLDRVQRSTDLLADQIKQEVRRDWRTLQQAKESYDIQSNSQKLAERRVDSTTMLLQAGRATTRDLLDAQSALLEAQNALINALVNHTIARLELWRDLETLGVTDQGDLKEENSVAANTRTE